jgi:hypothetical protein
VGDRRGDSEVKWRRGELYDAPYFVDATCSSTPTTAAPASSGISRGADPGALRDGRARLSTQVLAEYFAVATRKLGLSSAPRAGGWRSMRP